MIKCLVLSALIIKGEALCEANKSKLISVGFNTEKTTLIVVCENKLAFHLIDYLNEENKFLCLKK